MQIGGKEYSEIHITDADGGLIASITDKDVIEEKNCKVVCAPVERGEKMKETETEMLEKLCQPIIEWLEKKHDPYTQVQITTDRIELVQKVVGIPLKRTDDVKINRPIH